MSIPRIGLQSSYSFKQNFGTPDMLVERCLELGITQAVLADFGGTWGHVPWEISANAALSPGFSVGFGERRALPLADGREPRLTALAAEISAFYRFASAPLESDEQLLNRGPNVIILPGQATTNPDCFDYVDISHRSLKAARSSLDLAASTGKPIVLNPENDYPAPRHRLQFLAWNDSKRTTTQHVMTDEEMRVAYHFLDDETWQKAVRNTHELAERVCGLELKKVPLIQVEGDLDAVIEEGRLYRLAQGHISEWTAEYQARLERERAMVKDKKYESYFLVVSDMVRWAKERMLVGPARGSSAGSLLCYLTRITEVDPLVHNLLFERFIDVSRYDLPDIDIDFSSQHRELVFEYAAEKYGQDSVARLGNISRLKARSAIAHAGKKLGIPTGATFPVINVLQEHSSGDARYGKDLEDTLTNTRPGRDFIAHYPEAQLMAELEHQVSHTSVHAAGLIIGHVPIIDYCCIRDGIAHVDKAMSEYLNMLKIDALGLSTLTILEDAGVTAEEMYRLKLDDPAVFQIFNDQKFAGVFQFEGTQQRRVSAMVDIKSFEKISHVTALARPGPLVGGATNQYIERDKGDQPITYVHPSMAQYLSNTNGVVIYQEPVMRICFEIGGFDWATVGDIRKAMSGSKGPEYFNRHGANFIGHAVAEKGMSDAAARALWESIVQFGSWAMNESHTVSYGIISYWCAWMKTYRPLEFACALLNHAKGDDQTLEVLRELRAEGVAVLPFDRFRAREHWSVKDGELIGGYQNIVGFGPVKSRNYVEARDGPDGLSDKQLKVLDEAVIKFADLNPAHTLWGDMYEKPWKYKVDGDIKQFADLKDKENAVIIGQVKEVDRRDENEAIRIQRRGNKPWKGNSLFLDISLVDDSISRPVICRLRPEEWQSKGEKLADRLVKDQDWLLLRGRWLGEFNMMIVKKVRCLTNEDILDG